MATFNRIKDSSKIYLLHYDRDERWKASPGIEVEAGTPGLKRGVS